MNRNAIESSGRAPPPRSRTVLRVPALVLCCVTLCAGGAARAFTFADGATMRCIAAGQPIAEYDAPPGHRLLADNRIGVVEHSAAGDRIAWNAAKLQSLPPEMHDFIFFHECAHASVPTQDELAANCFGLKAMREAGRAGPAVEARLGAFYGRGNEFWRKTVACADGTEPAPESGAPR